MPSSGTIRGRTSERNHSRRLRAQAESQIRLLTEAEGIYEGDFYSYRYFATEGFLPGYNFPRLPISAYVPGRRKGKGRDEFISRPRFLAISEFGPRALIYHEGGKLHTILDTAPSPPPPRGPGRARTAARCGADGVCSAASRPRTRPSPA